MRRHPIVEPAPPGHEHAIAPLRFTALGRLSIGFARLRSGPRHVTQSAARRDSMIRRVAAQALWRLLALLCVVLGLIGVVVPGLPTVPFLLVAAWAGGRGWPQLEAWLLAHPRHGPHIRRWRDHRAVPRRAKWAASATMLLSTALIAASGAPWWVKLSVPATMAIVALWLWTRPER